MEEYIPLLNPCMDYTFKSIFTLDMPQSKIALKELVSDLIGHKVSEATVISSLY